MGIPLEGTEALFSMHISFNIKELVYEKTAIQFHHDKSKNAVHLSPLQANFIEC